MDYSKKSINTSEHRKVWGPDTPEDAMLAKKEAGLEKCVENYNSVAWN